MYVLLLLLLLLLLHFVTEFGPSLSLSVWCYISVSFCFINKITAEPIDLVTCIRSDRCTYLTESKTTDDWSALTRCRCIDNGRRFRHVARRATRKRRRRCYSTPLHASDASARYIRVLRIWNGTATWLRCPGASVFVRRFPAVTLTSSSSSTTLLYRLCRCNSISDTWRRGRWTRATDAALVARIFSSNDERIDDEKEPEQRARYVSGKEEAINACRCFRALSSFSESANDDELYR